MKRLLVVLVAALVLPATAQAKEITSLALCGPDECQDIDAGGYGHSSPFGGETGGPPAGHFYRLDIGIDGGRDAFSAYYEPVSGLLASPDRPGTFLWLRPSARLAPDLKAAAKLLEPFPAPRVIGARVGARQVSGEASTYSALLRLHGPPVVPKTSEDAVVIRLRPSAPNPWTGATLLYYPHDKVLFRSPGTYVRLPDAMAADVEAARPLGGDDGGGGAIVPWVPIGVGLAGAVVLLLPAAAQAKGMAKIELCGPDDCASAGSGDGDFFNFSGTAPGPPPGDYYELRLTFDGGAGHSQGIYYEPRSGLASYSESFGNPRWAPLREPFAARVKEAAKRVEPFPKPHLTAVYVGDRRVRDHPATYLKLFGLKGPFVVPARAGTLEFIRFESPDVNPWTTAPIAFYPDEGVLVTWGTYIKLPAPLAADLAAARPLGGTPGGGSGLPWIPIGAAIAGFLVLLGLALRRTSAREVAPVH